MYQEDHDESEESEEFDDYDDYDEYDDYDYDPKSTFFCRIDFNNTSPVAIFLARIANPNNEIVLLSNIFF